MTHHDPHSEAADAVHEGRPVDAQYVRGARPGKRILLLLIVSAGAAAILLLGMWFVSNGGFATTNANNGDQAVDAAAFDNSGPPTPTAPTDATGAPTPATTAPNVNPPAN
ncbi:hypothetical protein [Brevundimonas sp.]|uniref:hypothetical protein n=1 Tax=Brevundimonas sp. TaxID=1871086 RepID=UPI003D10A2FD